MSKIALIFFVNNRFHFEEKWRSWLSAFEPGQVLVRIIAQRASASADVSAHSEWVQRRMVTVNVNYITEGNPAWGSMDKLVHMHRAFSESAAEMCTHTLTLSDHCLPVVTPRHFWKEVTATTQSWVDVQLRPRNGYTALNQFTRIPGSVCKGDRYMLLVLSDLQVVVESGEGLHPYAHAKYADEMYVTTTLMRHGVLQASATLTPVATMDVTEVEERLRGALDESVVAERVRVRARDEGDLVIDVTARDSVDEPSADDIALVVCRAIPADVCYGRVRSRKVVFSMWNNSHMYPNSYVWDEELVGLSRSHDCLFAQVVIDVDHAFWDAWIAMDEHVLVSTGECTRVVQSDVHFRSTGKHRDRGTFDDDTYTAYHERVWPESECWIYTKRKLTTLR